MSTKGDEHKTVEVEAPECAIAESSDFDTLRKRNLSTVSKQYDIDGDGVLDNVELAMRNMDKDGVGHLSNEKVYKIMRDQIEANHKLFSMKRVVIVLSCLVVLLAVSNLGTAWAAFYLAKDTDVDESGTMHVKGTDKNVAVASAQQVFELKPDDSQRRMVAADCTGDGVVDSGCYSLKGLATGKITQADVNAIYQNVKGSVVVKIQVPNKCVSSATDTLTAYDPTMTYTTQFNKQTLKFLKTKDRNLAVPYFQFDCAASTTTNPYCAFTYETGSTEICSCFTFGASPNGSCSAGEGTKCSNGIDSCNVFDSATNGCDKTISNNRYCTCTGGIWQCDPQMSCAMCQSCTNMEPVLNGDYCSSETQKCNDANNVQCTCVSGMWSCP